MNLFDKRTRTITKLEMGIVCGNLLQGFFGAFKNSVSANNQYKRMLLGCFLCPFLSFRFIHRNNASLPKRLHICFVMNKRSESSNRSVWKNLANHLFECLNRSLNTKAKACVRSDLNNSTAHHISVFSLINLIIAAVHSSGVIPELSNKTASLAATAGATARVLSLRSRSLISARTSS